MSPRTSACSPWITGEDVATLPDVAAEIKKDPKGLTPDQINAVCAEAAAVATEILYNRTARIFTGKCGPVTIRPVARPVNRDMRGYFGGAGAWGLGNSWGACSWYGLGVGGVVSHFGDSIPPVIPFADFPVTRIIQVKIDGVVIPPDQYELREFNSLVRMRPTPSSVPTERYGWPTAQVNDLPDTQLGTFSITYEWGQDPGDGGRYACKRLARVLALAGLGNRSQLPQRLTSISRQGETAVIADSVDILSKGLIGLWDVDLWWQQINPNHLQTQPIIWSPDIGFRQRTQYPSR